MLHSFILLWRNLHQGRTGASEELTCLPIYSGSNRPLLIVAQMGAKKAIMIKNMMGIQRAAGCLQVSRTLVKGLIPHSLYGFFLRIVYQ